MACHSRNEEISCQHSPLWAAEAALDAAPDTTASGSEQISDYEPVQARIRSSTSSEESDSRSSLGSPGDWQVLHCSTILHAFTDFSFQVQVSVSTGHAADGPLSLTAPMTALRQCLKWLTPSLS